MQSIVRCYLNHFTDWNSGRNNFQLKKLLEANNNTLKAQLSNLFSHQCRVNSQRLKQFSSISLSVTVRYLNKFLWKKNLKRDSNWRIYDWKAIVNIVNHRAVYLSEFYSKNWSTIYIVHWKCIVCLPFIPIQYNHCFNVCQYDFSLLFNEARYTLLQQTQQD